MTNVHLQHSPAITTFTHVRRMSITCTKHGAIFTHDMPIANIWYARSILDRCHCRKCGGKVTLTHASKRRDLSRRSAP